LKKPACENIFEYASAAALIAVYVLMLIFLNIRLPYILDSDMASEMILGSILKAENGIMTESWYYSTELRVINTQLVYSLFLRITDNWHTVRLLSNAVLYIALILSTVYLCRKTGCRKYQYAVSAFILLPLSSVYFLIIDTGCYYIPHIIAEFLFFGLCMTYMRSTGAKKYSALVVSSLTALLTGMGGLRQLAVSYLPFLLCIVLMLTVSFFREGPEVCRKSDAFKVLPAVLAGTAAAGAGCWINSTVLSEKYDFMKFKVSFSSLNFERTGELLNDMLTAFGYKTGEISAGSLIRNFACAFIIIMTFYSVISGLRKNVSSEYRLLTVFFLSSLAVFMMLYTVTDMSYTGRYNIPVIVLAFPLTACAFREGSFGKAPECTGKVLTVVFAAAVFGRSFLFMDEAKILNRAGELVYAAEFLSESDYETGYASFWNANVLTELTDGKVDMYSWKGTGNESDMSGISGPDALYEWLQKKEHFSSVPSGRIFMLYKLPEQDTCLWKDCLRDEDLVWSSDGYRMYGYESYEAMKDIIEVTNEKMIPSEE